MRNKKEVKIKKNEREQRCINPNFSLVKSVRRINLEKRQSRHASFFLFLKDKIRREDYYFSEIYFHFLGAKNIKRKENETKILN